MQHKFVGFLPDVPSYQVLYIAGLHDIERGTLETRKVCFICQNERAMHSKDYGDIEPKKSLAPLPTSNLLKDATAAAAKKEEEEESKVVELPDIVLLKKISAEVADEHPD